MNNEEHKNKKKWDDESNTTTTLHELMMQLTIETRNCSVANTYIFWYLNLTERPTDFETWCPNYEKLIKEIPKRISNEDNVRVYKVHENNEILQFGVVIDYEKEDTIIF